MKYAIDWKKLVLAEIKPGVKLHLYTWAVYSGATYETSFLLGEVVSIEVDGIALTKETSAANCVATAGSFYYDFFAKKIYLHLTDGGDPDEQTSAGYTYFIAGYVWLGFSNRQEEGGEMIIFTPTDCSQAIWFRPYLTDQSIAALTQSLADYFTGALESSFGDLSFINDGWWYSNRTVFLWNNADLRIKIGSVGDAYASLETLFIGKVSDLAISDEEATFVVSDNREGRLRTIPTVRFNVTDYPFCDSKFYDKPVPILFGEKTNITPACVDTVSWVYKISQTVFDGVTYPLDSIDAVYKAGSALATPADYSVDLNAGTFTLTADPTTSKITCDAKGIKDAFNFATGAKTGAYSENVADHLFFILNVLNEIAVAYIDLASFLQLQTLRTQKIAFLLSIDSDTIEIIKFLMAGSIFHFLPLADGTFAAKMYLKAIPAGTPTLYSPADYADYKIGEQKDGAMRDIVLKFNQDPTTNVWESVSNSEDAVEWAHKLKTFKEIETALRDETEALTVLAFYVSLMGQPLTKASFDTSLALRGRIPSDKVILNRDVETEGGTVTIHSDEVYVILETRKDLGGKIGITGQLDSQLAVTTAHADVAHVDWDNDHNDTVHADEPYEDVPYEDYPHINHNDWMHDDYNDTIYYNPPAPYHEDYTDLLGELGPFHTDFNHIDIPHIDVSYIDHDDLIHIDQHGDVAYIDSEI